jgi:hypothetical protein
MNKPVRQEPLVVPDGSFFNLDIYLGPILLKEVNAALKSLKNGKASDYTGLPPELLKYGRQPLARLIFF